MFEGARFSAHSSPPRLLPFLDGLRPINNASCSPQRVAAHANFDNMTVCKSSQVTCSIISDNCYLGAPPPQLLFGHEGGGDSLATPLQAAWMLVSGFQKPGLLLDGHVPDVVVDVLIVCKHELHRITERLNGRGMRWDHCC